MEKGFNENKTTQSSISDGPRSYSILIKIKKNTLENFTTKASTSFVVFSPFGRWWHLSRAPRWKSPTFPPTKSWIRRKKVTNRFEGAMLLKDVFICQCKHCGRLKLGLIVRFSSSVQRKVHASLRSITIACPDYVYFVYEIKR